uniref:Uncharacterized protein n=1 Tax=Arundo donax TaxID=35708 RepID=A0A0A8Y924_ARUDO
MAADDEQMSFVVLYLFANGCELYPIPLCGFYYRGVGLLADCDGACLPDDAWRKFLLLWFFVVCGSGSAIED